MAGLLRIARRVEKSLFFDFVGNDDQRSRHPRLNGMAADGVDSAKLMNAL